MVHSQKLTSEELKKKFVGADILSIIFVANEQHIAV